MKPVDSAPLRQRGFCMIAVDERDVVLDAVDIEGVEGIGLSIDGGHARRRRA